MQRMARMHPRRQLNGHLQRLDDLQADFQRQTRQRVNERVVISRNLAARLRQVRPKQFLTQRRELLRAMKKRLHELAGARFNNCKNSLAATEARLRLLGPEQVLARGYSITMDAATGRVLRDAGQVQAGQRLKTRLQQGEVSSRAEK
jgi:exodeoxyribonuclease VII large subunit